MNDGNTSNRDALIRVFIGFDPREEAAFHVLCRSIHARATRPVCITPLALDQMSELMWRERHPLQSTDFSFSPLSDTLSGRFRRLDHLHGLRHADGR